MNEEDKAAEAARRKQAIGRLPAKLRKMVGAIRDRLESANASFLEAAHEIGADVVRVMDDRTGEYGEDPVGLMTVALDSSDRSFLLRTARFYRLCPDEKTLKWLTEARTRTTGRPLTWSHVIVLLTVDQADGQQKVRFREYAKLAIAEDLSPDELAARVRGDLRPGPPHAGGRPIAIPAKLPGKLANMGKVMSVIVRNHHELWGHSQHGIERAVLDTPADQIDAVLLDQIDTQRSLVQQAREALAVEAAALDRVYAEAARRQAMQAVQAQRTAQS